MFFFLGIFFSWNFFFLERGEAASRDGFEKKSSVLKFHFSQYLEDTEYPRYTN